MRDRGIVAAGKYCGGFVGPVGMLQRESNAGPGFASRAAADGIDHHHHSAVLGREDAVDIFRGPRLFDAETGQIFAHRD